MARGTSGVLHMTKKICGPYNLIAKQRVPFHRDVTFKTLPAGVEDVDKSVPFDLAGYSVRGAIVSSYTRDVSGSYDVLAVFTCAVINVSGGEATIDLTAQQSNDLALLVPAASIASRPLQDVWQIGLYTIEAHTSGNAAVEELAYGSFSIKLRAIS